MSDYQLEGPYVYQPHGPMSSPTHAKYRRFWAVAGLSTKNIEEMGLVKLEGLTMPEAEAIANALTKLYGQPSLETILKPYADRVDKILSGKPEQPAKGISDENFQGLKQSVMETTQMLSDEAFLNEVKEYIEQMEEALEYTRGNSRPLANVIAAGDMPDLYDEVIRRIRALAGVSNKP